LLSFIEINQSFSAKEELDSFDRKNLENPQEVAIYSKAIYNYLRKHEEKHIG